MDKTQPPAIPFLGIYLTYLTFNNDGNNDYLDPDESIINFNKFMKTADIIGKIQKFQNVPHHLDAVMEIQTWLNDCIFSAPKDEEMYYELSLKAEPKEREDEKIARLLQESGFL